MVWSMSRLLVFEPEESLVTLLARHGMTWRGASICGNIGPEMKCISDDSLRLSGLFLNWLLLEEPWAAEKLSQAAEVPVQRECPPLPMAEWTGRACNRHAEKSGRNCRCCG